MRVDFYHLTRLPLDRALPSIARRVVEEGGRLLIVSGDAGERANIDSFLWNPPESFLPHAQAGAGDDSLQPVLIGEAAEARNGARNIALVDGRWRDEALAFDRAFHFFDEEKIAEARLAWRSLGGRSGVERRYWKQNDAGRWEQVA